MGRVSSSDLIGHVRKMQTYYILPLLERTTHASDHMCFSAEGGEVGLEHCDRLLPRP